MPAPSALALFAVASLALLVVPGPAVFYIVTRSITQGRSAGLLSVLGVHAGSVVHVAAATVGLSALLASSAMAFSVVKFLGAGYLIWMGVQKLLRHRRDSDPASNRDEEEAATAAPASGARLFGQGVVVNVLNPKTAIFFLAFLPQFIDPHRGPVAAQTALLGCCFILLGMLSDGTYALLGSAIGGRLRHSRVARRRLDRASGVAYIGLGVTAAFATNTRHPA
jgi:threonine/homoserine/homoserine lactone efflux protein